MNTQGDEMREKTNLEIIKDAYEAFGRGDIDAVLSVDDPATELESAGPQEIPWAGSFRGHDGAQAYFAAIMAEADSDAFEPHTFLADGDQVRGPGHREGPVEAHRALLRESLGTRRHARRREDRSVPRVRRHRHRGCGVSHVGRPPAPNGFSVNLDIRPGWTRSSVNPENRGDINTAV